MLTFIPWFRPVAHTQPKRRSVVPRLVPLDDRIVPAGNVTVSVVAGDLIIKGDNNSTGNQVVVNEAFGGYTVAGISGTTVNGSSAFTAQGVKRDIRATFGAGNDTFEFDTSVFPITELRDVIINMGAGNDTTLVDNVFARNISIVQGATDIGADTVGVNVGVGTFGGRVSGNVAIANQKGAGTVTVNAAIGGNLTVANLDGGDTTTITAATEVGGAVRLTNTAGAAGNTVTLNGHVGRGVSIANPGTHASTVTLDRAVVGGSLVVTGGSGNDTVSANTVAAAESFGGNVVLNLGAGLNLVEIEGVANGARTTFGRSLIVTAAGVEATALDLTAVDVFGATSVLGGAGDDVISWDDCLFAGNVNVQLGAGDDSCDIEQASPFTGAVEFLGNLTIGAGTGTDQIRIAGSVAAETVYAYGAVAITQAETLTIGADAHHVGHAKFM